MMDPAGILVGFQLAAFGWLLSAVTMGLLWLIARLIKNAGVVDVGWTYLVAGLAVVYALFGTGSGQRRALVAAMFIIWGARLGTYLLRDRVLGRPEDGRYADLRQSWGPKAESRFFWFFQAQALAAVFFAVPALLPSLNAAPRLTVVELAAAALWALALAGESAADLQLRQFKARPEHRGRTCRAGLWRYSRHPNYFFEWLIWVAYALFAISSPLGWVAIACPAVMLFLLFRVTGIPATEAQAIRSRGQDYLEYQATTSAFVPWWPRDNAGAAPAERDRPSETR